MKNRAAVERVTDLYIEAVQAHSMAPIINLLDKEVIFSHQEEDKAAVGINAVTAKLNSFARVHLSGSNPYGALEATVNLKDEPAHPCAKVFEDDKAVSTVIFSVKPNGKILTISVLTADLTLRDTIVSSRRDTSSIREAVQAFADSVNTHDLDPLRDLLDEDAVYKSGKKAFKGRDTICKGLKKFLGDGHSKDKTLLIARTGTIDHDKIPACPCAVIYRGDKPLALVYLNLKINGRIKEITINPMGDEINRIHFSERENIRANADVCKQLAKIVKKFEPDKLRKLLTKDVTYLENGHSSHGQEEAIGGLANFLKNQKEASLEVEPQLALIARQGESEHPCIQLKAWGKVIALVLVEAKFDRRIHRLEISTDQTTIRSSSSTFNF